MRFRKGDRVEIMNKKDAPVSWRVAEIRSGNGHTYLVEYDYYPGMTSDQMVERVSRKCVRPCPPPVHGVDSCIVGDIVEVFVDYSWKIAAILMVLGGKKENKSNKIHRQAAAVQNQYLVRLLGCSQESIVERSNIRMRQSWHDDKWILMVKSSQGVEDVTASKPSTSNCYRKTSFHMPQIKTRAKNLFQKDCTNIQDDAIRRDSPMISSRSLKRMSPYCSSVVEVQNEHIQKLRAIEKDGKKQRVGVAPVLEKVDAVAYPKEFLGDKNMHASCNIISNGYNQMERAKLTDVRGFSVSRKSVLNTDSDECSVGSCSVTSQSPNNHYSLFIPPPCHETDTISSDAESCSGSGSERKSSSLPLKEEVEISIHRLELHAYRSTLEALYASGPLSWEQEALLTNLRITLHISNDEHLVELKHLISAKTAINVR